LWEITITLITSQNPLSVKNPYRVIYS